LSAVRAKLSGPAYPESVSLSASVSSAIEQARVKQTRSRNLIFAIGGAAAAVVLLIGWSQLARMRQPQTSAGGDPAATAQSTSAAPINAAPASTPAENVTTSLPSTASMPPVPVPKAQKSSVSERTTRTVTKTPPKPTPPRTTAQRTTQTTTQPATVSAPTNQVAPQNNVPQQPVVISQPPPTVAQRAVDTPKEVAPPPAPKPATLADLAPIIESYSRAIESGQIANVRRVYPGITSFQQRNLETFFSRARNINVRFRIEDLQSSTSSADARLVGTYEYTNSDGKGDTQPVSVAASFQRDGNSWRLVAIR